MPSNVHKMLTSHINTNSKPNITEFDNDLYQNLQTVFLCISTMDDKWLCHLQSYLYLFPEHNLLDIHVLFKPETNTIYALSNELNIHIAYMHVITSIISAGSVEKHPWAGSSTTL